MKKQKTEVQKQKAIIDQVCSLVTLSMLNKDKLHITVKFTPHVNWVECRVVHLAREYMNCKDDSCELLHKYIRLVEDDALEQLLALEDEIIDLLGEC